MTGTRRLARDVLLEEREVNMMEITVRMALAGMLGATVAEDRLLLRQLWAAPPGTMSRSGTILSRDLSKEREEQAEQTAAGDHRWRVPSSIAEYFVLRALGWRPTTRRRYCAEDGRVKQRHTCWNKAAVPPA
jgi:hypothetical protein